MFFVTYGGHIELKIRRIFRHVSRTVYSYIFYFPKSYFDSVLYVTLIMTHYDYQAGSQRIYNFLNQKMDEEDRKKIPPESQMTYSNGYSMWIGAIFVDIRRSTELFASKDRDMVTRIARSFVSEVIQILQSDPYSEIGIRGDCVYGIYSTPSQGSIYELYEKAVYVNTLMELLNRHYAKKKYPQLRVGIGLAVNDDLVVKAGSKGSGINDRIWVGKAVPTASNLSKYGSKNGIKPIVMSETVYKNAIEPYLGKGIDSSWFSKANQGKDSFYHGDVVNIKFNNWVKNNSGL